MKNKIILCLIIGLASLHHSCSDYLSVERYFNDRQSLEKIFKSRDYTEQWLANAYFFLLTNNLEIGHVNFTTTNFADDATYNETGRYAHYSVMKLGDYTPDKFSGSWQQSYDGIRQASILIHNVDMNEELSREEIDDLKGQAYFLRGYMYWLLLRKYGPIPILPDEGLDYDASYEELSLPRNSYDECAEHIALQMTKAAELLKDERDLRSAARPTKGSALAVRAKAYLYAASPLMNGNTEMADFVDHEGRPVISQTYDEGRWAKAAAACLDVIELGKYKLYVANKRTSGSSIYPATVIPPYHPVFSENDWPNGWKNIDPFESYRALFNGDLHIRENPESIFTRGDNQTEATYGILSMTRHQMPQYAGGYNAHGMTGKQCDAYAMDNGTPFDPATSLKGFVTETEADDKVYPHLKAGVWKEYANREPRFYASVAFNGSVWPLASSKTDDFKNRQAWYYRGEAEGRQASGERWQITGIGMMKYVNPKDSYIDNGTVTPKFDPAIRYADILLMYSESLNELTGSYEVLSWNGSKTHIITRDVNEMRKGILPIRLRGGIPDIDQSVYDNQDLLRKAIKHERQVELFAENQRYYDLRRWKDSPIEESMPIYGCNTFITKDNAEYFYERVTIPNLEARFSKKMYFWPVTYDELKRNYRLTQAPGWQSYD